MHRFTTLTKLSDWTPIIPGQPGRAMLAGVHAITFVFCDLAGTSSYVYSLGLALQRREQPAAALSQFQRVLELDPQHVCAPLGGPGPHVMLALNWRCFVESDMLWDVKK